MLPFSVHSAQFSASIAAGTLSRRPLRTEKGELVLAIVNQPQPGEAAQQAESRAAKLMQDACIRAVDRLVQEVAERLVEVLRAIETLLGPGHELPFRMHACSDRAG